MLTQLNITHEHSLGVELATRRITSELEKEAAGSIVKVTLTGVTATFAIELPTATVQGQALITPTQVKITTGALPWGARMLATWADLPKQIKSKLTAWLKPAA